MEVDLSDITIPTGVTRVDASVVAGHLTVRVPRDTAVSVDAHAGAGQVTVFGTRDEGRNANHSVKAGSDRRLVLTADTGIGAVDVVRG
jgi:predicted membrane protein